ncbi:hypothetical protein BTO16_17200 [Polaribacter glomeratus]|uniref:Uncharacterized protein n=2 Tax=Polaribacter glomeratus TaxID=102 RepID=A0A2S7WJR6_9FLAO|nr:hypothetical protein [Polaribacter glomeratus]PQJ77551.1 hypothetical protein BTO16_17200 [Polaribacter glomeratus]TXD66145.1 hypothetical protein ESX12_08285 [Polaribacter glomeratus]
MISCQNQTNKPEKPTFLIGNWMRLNDKESSQTYETWNTNFTGIGYTKQGQKTNFKEILSIIYIKDTLYLKVEDVNKTPTLFKFTQQTDTSFVCENPKNEFPKKIKYFLENNQLKAIVYTDDFRINFVFEKIK